MDRRQRRFADGAAALRRTATAIGMGQVLPPDGDFYACPCCLTAYGPEALSARVLTDEHVPPDNAGGKKLVLTCARCNHEAGSRLDAHADRRTAAHDLVAGRGAGRALRAEIAIDGIVLYGNITAVGDALLLSVVPKANNPNDLDTAERILDGWTGQGAVDGRFGFRLDERVSVPNARLSWVRAAYLAAFAAFGYRYAFLAQLAELRAQLANPDVELLPPLTMVNDDAPPDLRQLLLVREPVELRSLAVTIGRHTVFLPTLDQPRSFGATAAALGALAAAPGRRPRLLGKEVPWPTEPRYDLDR
jgi:hypothetical protein